MACRQCRRTGRKRRIIHCQKRCSKPGESVFLYNLPHLVARTTTSQTSFEGDLLIFRGYKTVHTLNRLFHLPTRWNLIRPLGQGAYGLVISVQDSLSSEPVAVKCITKVFDKVILARRALREITLLRHFGGHENLTGWVEDLLTTARALMSRLIDLDHVWDGYNEM